MNIQIYSWLQMCMLNKIVVKAKILSEEFTRKEHDIQIKKAYSRAYAYLEMIK